jgi:predicted HD phosphohydrolase
MSRNYWARARPGDSARPREAAASVNVENGAVTLSIDDIEQLLASGARCQVEIGDPGGPLDANGPRGASGPAVPSDEMPFTHLDHALQTAAVLQQRVPDDPELAVAGLVHDIGHLLPGVGDAEHAEAGEAAVRAALGERVARLVGLHVEAKRYLVARQATYGGELAADSVASLALQGGPMTSDEQERFERLPHAQGALLLRRADESGKVDGLVVPGLEQWMMTVRQLRSSTG